MSLTFSPAVVIYDSYGNAIGSEHSADGYKLLVSSSVVPGTNPYGTIPSNPQLIFYDKLKTTGNAVSLLVNGSSTPVEFKLNADVSYDLRIAEIRFVFVCDSFLIDGTSFGPITGLTNGIILDTQSNGLVGTLVNVKQNEDFLALYSPSGTTVQVNTVKDYIIAGIYFGGAIVLKKGTSDYIRARVRDNLTNAKMAYLTVTVHGAKE
jgi:hypothetical protein